MKKPCLLSFLLVFILNIYGLKAQITANPAIFTANQAVTLTYDATQSQGQALANLPASVTSITAHVGAILTNATGTTWTNVPGTWGDPAAQPKFTRTGTTNIYTLSLPNGIRSMFGAPLVAPSTTPIFRVGMVLRENGACGGFGGVSGACKEGKSTTGQDIFLNVNQGGLDIAVTSPTGNNFFVNVGQNQTVSGTTNIAADLEILVNNVSVQTAPNATSISTIVNVVIGTPFYDVVLRATPVGGGTAVTRNLSFLLRQTPTVQAIPAGLKEGINYFTADATKATLVFTAPEKKFIYVIGEFNNWQLSPQYLMKQVPSYGGSGAGSNPDNNKWWLEITGLVSGQKYAFQYAVYDMSENVVYAGDPYAEEVLEQFDGFIPAQTYPNPKPYPSGRTGIVPLLQTARPAYNWSNATLNFVKPDKKELIIYEVWVNDFDEIAAVPPSTNKVTGNYQMIINRLDYIQNLGVNAIQLMPIMEFNGNISWGYNPTFFCAVDKAYGSRDKLKELIDKCHQRGIAVILDIALNHAEFEFPGCKMYWNAATNQPASNNPWFNVQATHPFSVFQDFNHESLYTQQFSKRVIEYWINEFKIDGYRYDLAKGLTQTNTGSNVGTWNNYDASRVTILKRIADWQWAADPTSYCIFEFLATGGAEEAEYAAYRLNDPLLGGTQQGGIMFWRNMEVNYAQNIMGFNSNHFLGDADFANNPGGSGTPFQAPRVQSYMESHDEERVIYKSLNFGNNSQPNHNARDLATALNRTKAAIAFHIPVVGPKMIWQFGELGYDFSINYCANGTINSNCRTDPKPVRWDYFTDVNRKNLYDYYSAVNKLKTTYDAFSTTDNFIIEDGGRLKQLKITPQPYSATPTSGNNMNVIILANFDVVAQTINAQFHHTGTWYNYFDLGTEFIATSTNQPIQLQAGEVRYYTNFKLPAPAPNLTPYLGPFAFPAGLTATALSANGIKLDWTDAATNETGVRILRSTSLNGTYAVIATLGANVLTFNDSGLSANTQYFYKVETFNTFGVKQSNTANATTTATVINPANAPTNLTIASQTTTAVNLTWTDASTDETNFLVQRSVTDANNFTDLAVLTANTTAYIDNAVTIGSTYFYRVCARKAGANNACSNQVTTGVLALESNAFAQSITIYPNPANETIKVRLPQILRMVTIEVRDVMGKSITTLQMPENEIETSFDVSKLTQGTYFLHFNTEKGSAVKKMIKK